MSLIDSLLQILAWLIIAVPIGVLLVGIALYFLSPSRRKIIGIILITFGSFGLFIFSMYLYIALRAEHPQTLWLTLLAVEFMTLITGIVSLTRRKAVMKIEK